MDLLEIVRLLRAHSEELDEAISSLEKLREGVVPAKKGRRGRKSMSPDERREVSERMRAYWASRRSK